MIYSMCEYYNSLLIKVSYPFSLNLKLQLIFLLKNKKNNNQILSSMWNTVDETFFLLKETDKENKLGLKKLYWEQNLSPIIYVGI